MEGLTLARGGKERHGRKPVPLFFAIGGHPSVPNENDQLLRHQNHPLPQGHRRDDVIDEMGGGLRHMETVAGRTDAVRVGCGLTLAYRAAGGLADHQYVGLERLQEDDVLLEGTSVVVVVRVPADRPYGQLVPASPMRITQFCKR